MIYYVICDTNWACVLETKLHCRGVHVHGPEEVFDAFFEGMFHVNYCIVDLINHLSASWISISMNERRAHKLHMHMPRCSQSGAPQCHNQPSYIAHPAAFSTTSHRHLGPLRTLRTPLDAFGRFRTLSDASDAFGRFRTLSDACQEQKKGILTKRQKCGVGRVRQGR